MTTGILKYRLVELKYPINDPETPETRWYARAVQDRTIDFEDFVTHMSEHNSPYSRGVIHGVLIDMLSCLQELVLDGKSVRLGDLGLFSLGISGEGAPTRDVYNPTNYVKTYT
ncbi:HU family DNA-binding protein [Phocaeicola plebeius]